MHLGTKLFTTTAATQRVARRHPRAALTLIELLVVLFIISILLSLLLPAVIAARQRMQDRVCQNNIRQVEMALRCFVGISKRFPEPNRWSVDILKFMEEWPLADAMEGNFDPNADFPRPRLLRCPMQDDFSSRVPGVGYCHYVLVVRRPVGRKADRVGFELHDRQRLTSNQSQEPWFLAPELTWEQRSALLASKPGPHSEGRYMTGSGQYPR